MLEYMRQLESSGAAKGTDLQISGYDNDPQQARSGSSLNFQQAHSVLSAWTQPCQHQQTNTHILLRADMPYNSLSTGPVYLRNQML